MKTIITFGTFDLFHIGHLNILTRARQLGDRLVVGVSSDALNVRKKGRAPIYDQHDRMHIIEQLKCVDEVFLEESLALKSTYIRTFNASLLVMGDDWAGRFDDLRGDCDVVYLPRTPSISTTSVLEIVKKAK